MEWICTSQLQKLLIIYLCNNYCKYELHDLESTISLVLGTRLVNLFRALGTSSFNLFRDALIPIFSILLLTGTFPMIPIVKNDHEIVVHFC